MDLILRVSQFIGVTGIVIALFSGFIAIFKGSNPKQIFSIKGVKVGLIIFYMSIAVVTLLSLFKALLRE